MNYKLKDMNKRKGEEHEEKEKIENQVSNSSSVSFIQGRGTFSTLGSAIIMRSKTQVNVYIFYI